jgi:replication factor C subunit 3/5
LFLGETFAIMSDFEDDMDIDAPAVHDNVLFSSDNTTKGKRSAANLPVEAEDSLPWYASLISDI